MDKGKNLKVESSARGVLHGINGKCLYMECLGILIGIDLSVLLDDHSVDQFSDLPVKLKLNVGKRENVRHVGFKHFKLGKRLYLVGGEIAEEGASCVRGSNKILEFVPNFKYPEESIKDCDMPLLKAPRGMTFVAEVRDLICVIHSRFHIPTLYAPGPTFEVYDHNAKVWRELADAPEFVLGRYVVGDKLFVITTPELYCYNFFSNKWTRADEAHRSFQYSPIDIPRNAICLRGLQFGRDLHVMISVQQQRGFEKEDEVVTYAMILNKNGLLLCCQELGQIFSGIIMDMVESFFFDLGWEEGGNKRMLAVLIGYGPYGYYLQSQGGQPIACVSIFNLRKLDNGALADLADPPIHCDETEILTELPRKTFLEVTVIRKHVWILTKHIPHLFIGDAFLF